MQRNVTYICIVIRNTVINSLNKTKYMKKLTFAISYQPTNKLTAKQLKTAGIWKGTDGSYNERITACAHWQATQIAESKGTKVSVSYIESATDLAYCH